MEEKNKLRIEVIGLSNTGKTTISLMITDFLREKGFNVDYQDRDGIEDISRKYQKERMEIILDKIDEITIVEKLQYIDLRQTNG